MHWDRCETAKSMLPGKRHTRGFTQSILFDKLLITYTSRLRHPLSRRLPLERNSGSTSETRLLREPMSRLLVNFRTEPLRCCVTLGQEMMEMERSVASFARERGCIREFGFPVNPLLLT